MPYVYLALSIVAEVIATSSLKASEGFTKPIPSILVVVGYGVAFHFLSLTLKTIPVGVAYAVWAGAGVTLVAIVGWLLFGQKLDAPAIIGMAMIVAGVVVMQAFS
ncbi:MAG: multidrug efflux SMR transporter, partial [Hyphomonadaceae bacterium]|nr:multidrug efflux SMR transporter [Hyphomonadaceae bacterium]